MRTLVAAARKVRRAAPWIAAGAGFILIASFVVLAIVLHSLVGSSQARVSARASRFPARMAVSGRTQGGAWTSECATALDRVAEVVRRADLETLQSLEEAENDGGAVVPAPTRNALESIQDDLDLLTARILDGTCPNRNWDLKSVLAVDAVRLADAHDDSRVQDRLIAVGRTAIPPFLGEPRVPHGVLRRVRPGDPAIFLEWLDAETGSHAELQAIGERALRSVARSPWGSGCVRREPSFESPTLAGLHDMLPPPLHDSASSLVVTPLAEIRQSREADEILDARDELAALGRCGITSAWLQEPGHAEWATLRAAMLAREADILFTREVLRAGLPAGAVEPRSSGCETWSVTTEPLPDGSRRVTIVGVGAGIDGRPRSYDVPPPG